VLDEKAIEYCGLLCKEVLAKVGFGSNSVVACRARKDQKAQLLNLIKDDVPSACCLAIGDGANDVAMIKAGHLGVGIIGKEGMAAVNNSDFAIGQFRFLRHLLFVHGRFAYKRTSVFCYYMFYKNVTNVLAMYFYTMTALASGDRLFVQAYLEVYNIVFTSLPIILYGVFDQDVDKKLAARSPLLYAPGIKNIYYTHRGFVLWMCEAVYLAYIAIYIPAYALGNPGGAHDTRGWSLSSPQNGDPGIATISMTSMTLVCIGVNLRLAIEIHSWAGLEHLFMWGSIFSIELAALMFSFLYYPDSLPVSYSWNLLYGIVSHVWDDFCYWAVCLLVVMLTMLPRTLGKVYSILFKASASRRARRLAHAEDKRTKREFARSMSNAAMAEPTREQMEVYRSTGRRGSNGQTPAQSGVWTSQVGLSLPSSTDGSEGGQPPTPPPFPPGSSPTERTNAIVSRSAPDRGSRSTFSNNDRTSAIVLAQVSGSSSAVDPISDAIGHRASTAPRVRVSPTPCDFGGSRHHTIPSRSL